MFCILKTVPNENLFLNIHKSNTDNFNVLSNLSILKEAQQHQFLSNSSPLHIKKVFFFFLRMHFYLTIAQENKVTAYALGLEFRVWKWQSNRENIWIVEIQSTFTTNSLITYINWLANTISFIYFFNYWKKILYHENQVCSSSLRFSKLL